MKKISLIAFILISMNAYTMECPVQFGVDDYIEKVSTAIETQNTCYEASEVTAACAMGSSADVQLVKSALKQCSKRIKRSASVKDAVKTANRLCIKKFAKSQGTVASSARAFCQLEVAKLYDALLTPAEL